MDRWLESHPFPRYPDTGSTSRTDARPGVAGEDGARAPTLVSADAAASGGPLGGVVVHLDEEGEEKHQAVLRNVGNLVADLGEMTAVELVVHGPGIGLCLAESPQAEGLRELIGRGVVVAACENTLEMKGIGLDQLAAGVVTVPSGIGELVRKQQQGWAYVRP